VGIFLYLLGKVTFMVIKGIIYDFDGTIMSTEKLHQQAWVEAGKELGIKVTSQMILAQKGLPDEDGVLLMVPSASKDFISRFIALKQQKVIGLLEKAQFNPGFLETWKLLKKQKLSVWVCTSSHQNFMEKVFSVFPIILSLKHKTIWRERYDHPKPFEDPLKVTLKKMKLLPQECVFVGDAYGDYQTAEAARVQFVYFCIDFDDGRIPAGIMRIKDHRELMRVL